MQQLAPWAEIHEKIVRIVTAVPELERTTKWGSDVYTYKGKNVVSYGGFKHFYSIWFYNGVFIDDQYNVLVSGTEGRTKSLRQWRFTATDQVDEKKILQYIRQAIAIEDQGKRIQPAKYEPVPVPALLQQQLESNPELKTAFDGLTPGRQKEYILYLEEARQEQTRQNRLEKITPMILAGTGLNDKYKK